MKNITLSAKEEAIEQARRIAILRHSTLNDLFRKWLDNLNKQEKEEKLAKRLYSLWKQTSYFKVGKKLSREEMNER